jgi:hypothetical protein
MSISLRKGLKPIFLAIELNTMIGLLGNMITHQELINNTSKLFVKNHKLKTNFGKAPF